jgi:hypothetical protein
LCPTEQAVDLATEVELDDFEFLIGYLDWIDPGRRNRVAIGCRDRPHTIVGLRRVRAPPASICSRPPVMM